MFAGIAGDVVTGATLAEVGGSVAVIKDPTIAAWWMLDAGVATPVGFGRFDDIRVAVLIDWIAEIVSARSARRCGRRVCRPRADLSAHWRAVSGRFDLARPNAAAVSRRAAHREDDPQRVGRTRSASRSVCVRWIPDYSNAVKSRPTFTSVCAS